MTWVDLLLALGVLFVALAGWRAGVIATLASFAGFLGGAMLGAWLTPRLLEGREVAGVVAAVVMMAAMLVLGFIGQAVMGVVGRALRDLIDFGPLRVLDQAFGVVVSTLAFLTASWMLLSVAASVSYTEEAVRASRGYPILDEVLARPGSELIEGARSLLATFDLPSLPFNSATLPQVAAPADDQLNGAVAEAAEGSVVKVQSTSTRCGASQVGSGVVLANHRVVTNAHVIAGAGRITVRQTGWNRSLVATLVSVDRRNDVAVLYVPDLDAPVLSWASDSSRGTPGAVAGYPGGGRLTVGAARVRGTATVAAEGDAGTRRVLVFRGLVRPGNSGGALLDTDGDLMGVVFANSSTDDDTGFALTREEVRPALSAGVGTTERVSSGACISR